LHIALLLTGKWMNGYRGECEERTVFVLMAKGKDTNLTLKLK